MSENARTEAIRQALDAALPPGQRTKRRLTVAVRAIAEGRADRLIPLWAQTWLEAQHHARRGSTPVAIVGADRISPKAAESILAFIRTYAPDAVGGVMDLQGHRRFTGAGLEQLNAAPSLRPRARPNRALPARRGKLFSDLNQWMLKVLLAPRIPEPLLMAPREPLRGASALAAAADVSVMSASRLVRELEHEGFLDTESPTLRLVRVDDLLRRWQAAVSAEPIREQHWRAVLPGQAAKALERWMEGGDACWALFVAAQQHWFGFVEDVVPYAYVKGAQAEDRLAANGFIPAGPGERPDVLVRQPAAQESVFRGMVYPGRRPSTDIIQTWLDVSSHPTRGKEQADRIWRKVFAPLLPEE